MAPLQLAVELRRSHAFRAVSLDVVSVDLGKQRLFNAPQKSIDSFALSGRCRCWSVVLSGDPAELFP